MKPSGLVLLIAAVVLVTLGCTEATDIPPLGSVTGTVTLDGKPLVEAMVTFSPTAAEGMASRAATDESGKYELRYGREDTMGAALGTHSVSILKEPAAAEAMAKAVNIPAIYNRETQLTATVKEGPNTFDFPLKSQP